MYGDSSRFSQVISNLVANAIDSYDDAKSKRPRQVKVSTFINTKDKLVTLSIADKGSGIPAKAIKKIFEPFFTTKSSEHGTGIGLTITKRIIEEDFLGNIEVSSERGKGTVFILTLPLYKDDK